MGRIASNLSYRDLNFTALSEIGLQLLFLLEPACCPAPTLWATLKQRFRDGWAHAQGLMRPDTIVLPEPGIDDSLRLIERSKPLGIQDFTAQRSLYPFDLQSILDRLLHDLTPMGYRDKCAVA